MRRNRLALPRGIRRLSIALNVSESPELRKYFEFRKFKIFELKRMLSYPRHVLNLLGFNGKANLSAFSLPRFDKDFAAHLIHEFPADLKPETRTRVISMLDISEFREVFEK